MAFGPKFISPTKLKTSIYSKESLPIYRAFFECAYFLRETTKPAIVLTDNKSILQFYQTKAIPPSFWNAYDYVLQNKFKVSHNAGSVNTAADFLSRLELWVTVGDVSQNPRRHTDNTHWGDNILHGLSRRWTVILDTNRWSSWERRTGPWMQITIRRKGDRMGSNWETILKEAKYQEVHKDRRKHYVVLHELNQGNCTDTSRPRCWPSPQDLKTQKTLPTTSWSTTDNRQTI